MCQCGIDYTMINLPISTQMEVTLSCLSSQSSSNIILMVCSTVFFFNVILSGSMNVLQKTEVSQMNTSGDGLDIERRPIINSSPRNTCLSTAVMDLIPTIDFFPQKSVALDGVNRIQ